MAKASLRAVDAGGIAARIAVPHGCFAAKVDCSAAASRLPSNAEAKRRTLTPLDAFWSTAKEMTFSSMNTYASNFFSAVLRARLPSHLPPPAVVS